MASQSAWTLWRMGRQAFERGDFALSIRYSKQAADVARDNRDAYLELMSLEEVAIASGNLSEEKQAIQYATKLMIRAKELDNKKFQMCGGLRLCESMASMDVRGKWHEIRPLLLEGLEIARSLNDRWYEIYHLTRLGFYDARCGNHERALEHLDEALSLMTPFINKSAYFYTEIYSYMSFALRKQGKLEESQHYADISVVEALKHGNPNFICEAELFAIEVRLERGEYQQSLLKLEVLHNRADQNMWRSELQTAKYLWSLALLKTGDAARALPLALDAIEIAKSLKAYEEEVEAMLRAATIHVELEQYDDAKTLLQTTKALADARHYNDHRSHAEKLLEAC